MSTPSPAVRLLRDLYAQLLFLIEQGLGESQEADDLRDRMDDPWYSMTDEEHTAFKEGLR